MSYLYFLKNSANIFRIFFQRLKFHQTLLLSGSTVSLFRNRRCEVVDEKDKCSWPVVVFGDDIFGFINDVDGKSINCGDFVLSSRIAIFLKFEIDLNVTIYSIHIIIKLKWKN